MERRTQRGAILDNKVQAVEDEYYYYGNSTAPPTLKRYDSDNGKKDPEANQKSQPPATQQKPETSAPNTENTEENAENPEDLTPSQAMEQAPSGTSKTTPDSRTQKSGSVVNSRMSVPDTENMSASGGSQAPGSQNMSGGSQQPPSQGGSQPPPPYSAKDPNKPSAGSQDPSMSGKGGTASVAPTDRSSSVVSSGMGTTDGDTRRSSETVSVVNSRASGTSTQGLPKINEMS